MASNRFLDGPTVPRTDVRPRLGRAISLSLGTHIAGVLVLAFFATGRSSLPVETNKAPNTDDSRLVWLPVAGPDGGGDGGGNRSAAPPQAARVRGTGQIAVPPLQADRIDSSPNPRDRQLETVSVPFQPATAGLENLTGLLQPVRVGEIPSRGPGDGTGAGTGNGARLGSVPGPGWGNGPPGVGGIDWPRPISQVKPQYTSLAMQAKIQGTVTLEAIVLPDGTVGEAKVVRSLDPVFGLDQAAIAAVKQWTFKPGTRAGQAIPVLVTIELTFTLR